MSGHLSFLTCRRIAFRLGRPDIPKYDIGDVLNPDFSDELHKHSPNSPSGAYINDILWQSFKRGGIEGLEAEVLKHVPEQAPTLEVVATSAFSVVK